MRVGCPLELAYCTLKSARFRSDPTESNEVRAPSSFVEFHEYFVSRRDRGQNRVKRKIVKSIRLC